MINKKEITTIIILTLILAFSITLVSSLDYFLSALLGVFLALIINILIKKIAAFYLDTEIEIKIWEFRRWGAKAHYKFKNAFPAGVFIPVISRVIFAPLNGFIWMASMVFDVKAKKYKTAKRHGYYSFSEATENHIGGIAAAGVIANLFFAVIFYMIGAPFFAKINIWMAFFNLIPLSDLDGNKIFFGNLILWIVLAIISLIALTYAFFLV
jgi:Zn-dependent protease